MMDSVILFSLISIPLICLVSLSLMAMISTARTKVKAEAGHPCLIPRKTLKGEETHPLFRIQPLYNSPTTKRSVTIHNSLGSKRIC
jgi:hypothetical protein